MKKNSNNKGFSLVELIIVIAIMAILAGVIVLAVFPRIEQSRRQTDATTMQTWRESAVEAYSLGGGTGTLTLEFTVDANGKVTNITGDNLAKFCELASDCEADASGNFKECKSTFGSTDGKGVATVTIKVDKDNPDGTITVENNKFDKNGNPV